jgi:hypothetical protein
MNAVNKSSQQKGFFPHWAFAPQIGQNHGLESFAPLRTRLPLLLQKFLCPCRPQATLVLPAFARSCFADAERKENPINPLIKRIKVQKFALGIKADTGPSLRPAGV